MRWIHKLSDLWAPEEIQEIRTQDVEFALQDITVRKIWLQKVFDQIRQCNLDVDSRLRKGNKEVSDLVFKRQALQGILEAVFEAKRQAKGYDTKKPGEFDLASVTVQPV